MHASKLTLCLRPTLYPCSFQQKPKHNTKPPTTNNAVCFSAQPTNTKTKQYRPQNSERLFLRQASLHSTEGLLRPAEAGSDGGCCYRGQVNKCSAFGDVILTLLLLALLLLLLLLLSQEQHKRSESGLEYARMCVAT